KWKNSLAYTLEALAVLPDSSLQFRPDEEQMSVQEQVQHISGNVYGLSRRFLGYAPANFSEAALRERLSAESLSREELIKLLNDAYAFGSAAIRSLNTDDLDQMVPNFFAGPKSKRVIVYLLQDHATHHRAQLLMYLRLLGHQPPRYRGW
ncbi:MAG: DinB family protein, partial [Bacteroidota bacterium]